jgi:hypothetical protein
VVIKEYLMQILSINRIDENTLNVIFSEDAGRYGDQCRNTEELQRFAWADIQALIASDPSIIDRPLPTPEIDLVALRLSLNTALNDVERPSTLAAGFTYNTHRVQADPVAQQNATGILTAITSGVPVSYPVMWRTLDNYMMSIPTKEAYLHFSGSLMAFVQAVFSKSWSIKDAMEVLTTADEIQTEFDTGVAQMYLIGDNV